MIQFKLRSIFAFVSAISVLLALSLQFPVIAWVLAVLAGAVIPRWYASKRVASPGSLWLYASCGAAVAMVGCLTIASLHVNPDGTRIGWGRALPASLCVGVFVGTIVSLIDRADCLRGIPCEMRIFGRSDGRVRPLR